MPGLVLLSLASSARSGEPCWLYPINIGAPSATSKAKPPARGKARYLCVFGGRRPCLAGANGTALECPTVRGVTPASDQAGPVSA